MHIFNEYVHTDVKHQLNTGEWLITYEPTDHIPADMMGFIHKNEVLTAFGTRSPLRYALDVDINDFDYRCISLNIDGDETNRGGMWADSGMMEIVWKEDPGEHFLCVCYRTQENEPTYKERNRNWLQEGF
jgi:hypothetical protein